MHKRHLLALLVCGVLACSNEISGPRGPAGETGPVGPVGPQGERGEKGDKGEPGLTGPVGEQGPRGEVGTQGPQGEVGPLGATGPQGIPGLSVDAMSVAEGDATCQFGGVKVTAASGDVYVCNGAPGAQGPQGVDGVAGIQGPQGIAGDAGPQGPVGPQGDPGQSVVGTALALGDANCPSGGVKLSGADGDRYVCNGAVGEVGPQGPQGPIGPQGAQGAPGESVVAAALAHGDSNCPHGGSQFDSGSATTFACNGAPGAIGPPGPTPASVYDGNGIRVGDFLSYELRLPNLNTNPEVLMHIIEEWGGRRVIVSRIPDGAYPSATISVASRSLFYTEANCAGPAYVEAHPTDQVFSGHGKYFVSEGPRVTVRLVSSYSWTGGCSNYGAWDGLVFRATEVVPPVSYAKPLSLRLN